MIGITGYGAYIPRLRLSRQAVVQANAWFAPQFTPRAQGTRAMANWDEDSITMAVAAARDCLGPADDRSHVRTVLLASSTLPFAERQNAGIAAAALTLDEDIETLDITGSQRAGLAAVAQALTKAPQGDVLVLAADARKTRPASAAELDYGDGAAALRIGTDNVLAEYLGGGAVSVDFVDHFRPAGEDINYQWEERWIRDEGIGKILPRAIRAALADVSVAAGEVDHFIFPTTFARLDAQLAKSCGIKPEAVVDNLASTAGDTGTAHPLLLLAHILQSARPGAKILVAQFGSGAQALLFRATGAITSFRPQTGVAGWLARGVAEPNYTKFLAFKDQLHLERGMRGEQDKKTALTALYRHRKAIMGLIAGRCTQTGQVHFPPSRLAVAPATQGLAHQDTQIPHKLAERRGKILSWSAEFLSYHPAPPNHYGQIDFDGGGRILMEFTDLAPGDIDTGTVMEMVFRIKDFDEKRGFTRYFWKATPLRAAPEAQ